VNAPLPGEGSNLVPAPDGDPIKRIEERLVNATDPREILLWTQVRSEVIRQNDAAKGRAREERETEAARFKMGFSIFAVPVGVFLIQTGEGLGGYFSLGVGFYGLAPNFVTRFFSERGSQGGQ
jgi:hypothetical protein